MAITVEQRTSIIELVVGMFGAAPGASVLSDLVASYEAGSTLKQIAASLANTNEFKGIFPTFLTNGEYATKLVNQLVGSEVVQAEKDAAVTTITSMLNAGQSRSSVFVDAIAAVNAITSTNTAWANAGAAFDNKVAVAVYYSVDKQQSGASLSALQNVIANVGSAAASVTTAKSSIDGTSAVGSTFTFTTSVDNFTGAAGNDVFVAQTSEATAASNTFTAVDTIVGGAGTDTLSIVVNDYTDGATLASATVSGVEVIKLRAVDPTATDVINVTATNFAGATEFTLDRSSSAVTFAGLAAGQIVNLGGNGSVTNGAVTLGYGATVTSGTINFVDGYRTGAVTQTGAGISSNTINSTGAANTAGVVTLSGTVNKSLTINAATALTVTSIGGLTAGATITASGAATSATGVGLTLGTLDSDVIVLNAGGMTAGGVSATLNADTTIVVTGGAGNDRITTGSILTTGSVTVGGGTADRLTIANDTHINTLALGNKYSGFEVVQIAAGGTQDLDLLATNNTLTALRLAGSATVTNVNSATAGAVTILANSTPSIGVKGALTPGQLDTVNITVSDESATVNTITLTAPVLNGVETLGLVATDNTVVTSLANALALTKINVSGAGTSSITTTGIALQTNFAVDAGSATGNATFDATGATTNGFGFTGGSGVNTVTGGNQVFSVNLAKSTAQADVITLTNATGGTTSLANATITGFTNSATVSIGDKLDVIGTATIQADVAAGTATGITNLTGAVTNGVMTFAGTAAASATLENKINAAASANFAGALNEVIAFEHGGNTYLVSQQGTTDAFNAGTDLLIQLTGLTGVTALSTTASGATTVWVV